MKSSKRVFLHFICFCVMVIVATPSMIAEASEKIVYHVSDADKLVFALDDIRDRVKQSEPGRDDIILVVDGPASKRLLKNEATENMRRELESIQKSGVQTSVCGDSMKFYKMHTSDLLPGIVRLEQGSNARLEELRAQGYEVMDY